MSAVRGQRITLRCFAEGQEIPAVAAMVQMNMNAPASCTLQVIPIDELHELKPKTMIHVFYFDNPLDDVINIQDLSKYRLLFAGETVGISFQKTPTGRSAVLQCIDFSNNWDLCYQFMITYGPNGNFLTEESAVWAGASNMFDDILDGHSQVLSRYLGRTPKTPGLRNVKGLLGGIISLIEAMGGVRNHIQGVNDYFTISELKNRTLQQVTAEENDNTAVHLFNAKEFMRWLEQGVSQLGELVTIRDMLKLLFGYIYYEIAPNTCAMYVPGSGQNPDPDLVKLVTVARKLQDAYNTLVDDKIIEEILPRVKTADAALNTLLVYPDLTKDQKKHINQASIYLGSIKEKTAYTKEVGNNIVNAKKEIKGAIDLKRIANSKALTLDRLNSLIFKPECYFVSPPRCNVFFPEQITQFSYGRNYMSEITRLRLQSGMAFGIDKDKLLAEYAWAPALPQIKNMAKKQGSHNVRTLLPWEKFTGIQPKFVYVNEINYYANKKQKDLQKNLINHSISYRQKAANFNFFKHRFGSRGMSISMRFNPFVVLGFPALVIDKPFIVDREEFKKLIKSKGLLVNEVSTQDIIDKIKDAAAGLRGPTQYLGGVMSITHSLSADSNSATTSVELGYCRTHRVTDDDFLTIFQKQKVKEAGIGTVSTRLNAEALSKSGDGKLLQFLIDATPQEVDQQAIKTNNQSATQPFLTGRPKLKVEGIDIPAASLAQPLPSDQAGPPELVGEVDELHESVGIIYVPKTYGKLQPGSNPGPQGGTVTEVQVINNGIYNVTTKSGKKTKTKYAWKEAAIYEEVKNPTVIKTIPIEEALRPSWFSPLYSNLYIGNEIYMKFFGTGSLVDEIVFQNTEGFSIQGAGGIEKKQILDKLGESSQPLEDVEKLKQDQIGNIPDVETAANVLAFQYGETRRLGLDSHKFIYNYTYRPIATLEQMLGSADLTYEVQGNKLVKKTGVPGFHSTSIGFDNLLGLVDNPDIELSRLNDDSKSKISRSLDPRKPRRDQVVNYKKKLQTGSGFVIGVLG